MNKHKNLISGVVVSLSLAAGPAMAQGSGSVAPSIPYLLDGQGKLVRSGTGQCIRTGYWSIELARTAKLRGEEFPVGCACDRPSLTAELCEPPPPPAPVATPVAPPPPAAAPAAPAPVSEKVTIPADTLFEFDKAVLTSEGTQALQDFVTKMKGTQLEVVVATGHADRIGTEAYNQRLSEKRAATVKDFLIAQGVDANKVYTEGKGESQPKTSCTGLGREVGRNRKLVECLAPDRRVELEAVGTRTR